MKINIERMKIKHVRLKLQGVVRGRTDYCIIGYRNFRGIIEGESITYT